jgi:GxxExxY protein
MQLNEISGEIVDAAFKIHTQLGPGLLESAYERVLAYELRKRELKVERNKLCQFVTMEWISTKGFD